MKRAIAGLSVLAVGVVAGESAERTFELAYVAEVEVPEGSNRLQMWLPYPNRSDHQDIRLVGIEAPVSTKVYQEYTYRNSMLFLSTRAADHERLHVEVKLRVTRREHVEKDFRILEDPEGYIESSARRWLRPDDSLPIDESMEERAGTVTEGITSYVDRAKAIYDAVLDDPELEDTAASFVTLARAARIPAKFAVGLPIPRATSGKIEGPRAWAEFYVPGFGWVPVDTAAASEDPDRREYFFGAHDENRVELTVGRDIKLNPLQSGKPLSTFGYPYAEVDGEPVRNVEAQFSFEELGARGQD